MAKATLVDNQPDFDGRRLIIEIERQFSIESEGTILAKALQGAAQKFAEDWLERNRDKVIERLNVDAIANMVMIEVSTAIRDDIERRR